MIQEANRVAFIRTKRKSDLILAFDFSELLRQAALSCELLFPLRFP